MDMKDNKIFKNQKLLFPDLDFFFHNKVLKVKFTIKNCGKATLNLQ